MWTASIESYRDATRRGRILTAAFFLLGIPMALLANYLIGRFGAPDEVAVQSASNRQGRAPEPVDPAVYAEAVSRWERLRG